MRRQNRQKYIQNPYKGLELQEYILKKYKKIINPERKKFFDKKYKPVSFDHHKISNKTMLDHSIKKINSKNRPTVAVESRFKGVYKKAMRKLQKPINFYPELEYYQASDKFIQNLNQLSLQQSPKYLKKYESTSGMDRYKNQIELEDNVNQISNCKQYSGFKIKQDYQHNQIKNQNKRNLIKTNQLVIKLLKKTKEPLKIKKTLFIQSMLKKKKARQFKIMNEECDLNQQQVRINDILAQTRNVLKMSTSKNDFKALRQVQKQFQRPKMGQYQIDFYNTFIKQPLFEWWSSKNHKALHFKILG